LLKDFLSYSIVKFVYYIPSVSLKKNCQKTSSIDIRFLYLVISLL